MSDDVFSVATRFADVASLAQGYMNRADGERLLLPLPSACKPGAGVRFVVYLEDGTPAFAGAGLCSQVSDQGTTVPEAERYETLLDTLQFDERSRPVYDYIVAVRNAAYAQQGEVSESDVIDADVESEGSQPSDASGEVVVESELQAAAPEGAEATGSWSEPVQWAQPGQWSEPAPADMSQASAEGDAPVLSEQPSFTVLEPGMPSFVPPPLPTGLLTRPARTTHWQPAPPHRPTPRPATGQFRYGAGGLPRPARPPYPDLDPSQWIRPAPRPGS